MHCLKSRKFKVVVEGFSADFRPLVTAALAFEGDSEVFGMPLNIASSVSRLSKLVRSEGLSFDLFRLKQPTAGRTFPNHLSSHTIKLRVRS